MKRAKHLCLAPKLHMQSLFHFLYADIKIQPTSLYHTHSLETNQQSPFTLTPCQALGGPHRGTKGILDQQSQKMARSVRPV